MEHLAFFHLSAEPFRNDPALDGLFRGAPQRAAQRRLHRLVRQGKELALLTGWPGTGKTTLLRALFEDVDPEAFEPAFIVISRGVEPAWLRRSLAAQLGVEEPSRDRAEGMRELYQRVVELHHAGRRCVVMVDEAQALDGPGLAELRSWMNLESEERKLLSVILAGDRELARQLEANGLLDRVEAQVEIGRFDAAESRAYLEHRLKAVGGHAGVFEDDAYTAIAELAGGVARRLNTLADNALFESYLAGRTPATREDVVRAARELPWITGPQMPDDLERVASEEERNGDSLDYVTSSFDPGASNSMGVGATRPDIGAKFSIEDEPGDSGSNSDSDSSGLLGLDDSIGGAFARMTDDDGASLSDPVPNPEDSVEIPADFGDALLSDGDSDSDLDADPVSVPIEEELEIETPAESEASAPEPAGSGTSMVPEEDEIEGLFENLVQED